MEATKGGQRVKSCRIYKENGASKLKQIRKKGFGEHPKPFRYEVALLLVGSFEFFEETGIVL